MQYNPLNLRSYGSTLRHLDRPNGVPAVVGPATDRTHVPEINAFFYSAPKNNRSNNCSPKYATMIVISNIPIVRITRRNGARIGSVSTYDHRHHLEYGDPPTQLEMTRAKSAICRIPNVHRTATNKIDPDSAA